MLFEDKDGKILTLEEVNSLGLWELDERQIHTYDKSHHPNSQFDYDDYS